MLLGARQFFERRGAPTPPLPYDYAVEYIETDGVASYINTGVTPPFVEDSGSVVRLVFNYVSWDASRTINGANTVCGAASGPRNSACTFRIGTYMSKNQFRINYPTTSVGPILDTNKHEVEMTYTSATWDGDQVSLSSWSKPDVSGVFCLGSRGAIAATSGSERWFGNARFYSCKIYTNNVLVFDGIPVVANGVAGIYDSISGTFKGNAAASGTITAGPRV